MSPPTLRGERLTIRPLSDADVERLVEVIASPGVREWWPSAGRPDLVRDELGSEPGWMSLAIEVEGGLAGWLGIEEEADPFYRHAALDIVLAPRFQDRGLGPEALRTAIRWLIDERGHHRFTIDPVVENERAIRAYGKVGFEPVGVLRRSERQADGSWRDSLLMDLLAEELR